MPSKKFGIFQFNPSTTTSNRNCNLNSIKHLAPIYNGLPPINLIRAK